jgi:nucleoside phosphorylase
MIYQADVLIVTVTKVETRAAMQAFEQKTGVKAIPQSIEKHIYFDLGTIGNAQVFLTQSEMGTSGLGASLLTVYKGIEMFSPTAVIMVGIAFGVNDQKQSIGDILVTEQLRQYELQRVSTQNGKEDIIVRGDKPHASSWLLNHLRSADLSWEGAKVHFGTVLTGDKLVDNIDYRERLHSFDPEAIGGEMEGAGLYVACQNKKVDWILVKGICDWADGNKRQDKESRQKIAASNAIAFLLHSLQFASLDWRKQRAFKYPCPIDDVRQNVQKKLSDSGLVKPEKVILDNSTNQNNPQLSRKIIQPFNSLLYDDLDSLFNDD